MSRLEKFGLITGAFGLIGDLIAFVGFIAGLINFSHLDDSSAASATAVLLIVSALILIYGWLSISWILANQALNKIAYFVTDDSLKDNINRIVAGVGFVIAPLIAGWAYICSLPWIKRDLVNLVFVILFFILGCFILYFLITRILRSLLPVSNPVIMRHELQSMMPAYKERISNRSNHERKQ
jgi:hypothetical protein